jgi:hypothetical protein
MTENDTEATEPEQSQPTSAPVRVPNVSPGAKSGIDHQVIGGAAQDAYDATEGAHDGEDATGTDDGTAGEAGAEVPTTEAVVGSAAPQGGDSTEAPGEGEDGGDPSGSDDGTVTEAGEANPDPELGGSADPGAQQ